MKYRYATITPFPKASGNLLPQALKLQACSKQGGNLQAYPLPFNPPFAFRAHPPRAERFTQAILANKLASYCTLAHVMHTPTRQYLAVPTVECVEIPITLATFKFDR